MRRGYPAPAPAPLDVPQKSREFIVKLKYGQIVVLVWIVQGLKKIYLKLYMEKNYKKKKFD